MKCIDPQAISPSALLKYVLKTDGYDTEIAAHVEACFACQQEILLYRQNLRNLATRLARFDCPSADDISAYAVNETDDDSTRFIEQHAARCTVCAEKIALSREFMQLSDPYTS
jgi:hypothetical protein